jgi:hypothetical protein
LAQCCASFFLVGFRKCFAECCLSFFASFQRRIYLRDNPAELFGKHVYQMETYRLDPAIVANRFRKYVALHRDAADAPPAATPLKKSFG